MKTKSLGLMLAHNLFDHKEHAFERTERDGCCLYQPKLNGVRARADRDGILSRNGNRILPDLHAEMSPLFRDHPDLVLDGEIWSEDCGTDLSLVLSRLKTNSLNLRFFAFDVINHDQQIHRLSALRKLVEEGSISEFDDDQHPVAWAGAVVCNNIEDFYAHSLAGIQHGIAEGGMWRSLFGRYTYGRSKDLLKFKVWEEEECTVLNEFRNDEGQLCSVHVEFQSGARLGCNLANSPKFWASYGTLVGKTVVVRFMLLQAPLNGTVIGVV